MLLIIGGLGGGARHGVSVGGDEAVASQWRCRRRAWRRGGNESSRRSERSLDRLGFVGEVCGGGEPRVLSSSPHLLNIALRDGPTSHV
jgi:hypothetical protein